MTLPPASASPAGFTFRVRASQRKQVLRQWYLDRANEKILPRVRLHAKNLGVTFQHVRIVDNRYRWGSCTPSDNLRFNWRLIKAPMFVIYYVLVHELAHLLEANHTPRFWSIVHAQTASMHARPPMAAREWAKP